MITILLNIIGIACILISLIIISKTANKEKNIYKEIIKKYEDIKYYYKAMDNILNSFSDIVHISLNKVESYNTLETRALPNTDDLEIYQYQKKELLKDYKDVENNRETFRKIVELKKQGLSNKEIAKRLNKGVREVEIIIKMLESN